MYTNARSMGNKQEELEVMVQQQSCDVVTITETWRDDSHSWSTALNGYELFRRDRKGRRGGGMALYIKKVFDSIGIETNEDGVECLWVRIKGKANKADIVLGVCYHPPHQEEEVDNLFYKQLETVSGSSALVLVGDFNLPDICWELNTAEKRQSRKFLDCMDDNFLSQLVGEPTRGETMLDLLFTNRDGLVGDVVVGGRLGQSDHEIIEFSIIGEIRRYINRTFTLDFQRADFGLFKRLIQRVPWEEALKNKGLQESWVLFKTEFLKAQEQTVPVCPKTSRRGKRPAWISKEVLDELRNKKRIIFGRRARSLRKYLRGLLENEGNIVTADEEKAEVLNAFFASVFSGKTTCLQDNCPPGLVDGVREQNGFPIIQEEAIREQLRCLDAHKSMGPDGIHPRVMRELADDLAKPLSIIYNQSWLTGEVPEDWKLASVTPIHNKGGKEDPSSYRPASLTSVPGKIMEQFILSVITQHLQDGQGLRPSQHGFRRVTNVPPHHSTIRPGFPVPVNTNNPGVRKAARFGVYRYNNSSNDLFLFKESQIKKAMVQIVRGLKYMLHVEIKRTVCEKRDHPNLDSCHFQREKNLQQETNCLPTKHKALLTDFPLRHHELYMKELEVLPVPDAPGFTTRLTFRSH
ncbi:hypothetical protein HGM15179_002011 [Zosterops borbonicus]|uniref:Egg-white cystatin n=1 Tax=Zosterops borbonicus TaxID=364589 RepID=A0A8K1GVH6_9PASS|nr:hypothetical protein HGM15179_002011 [Zosterops borbonicus]